MRHFWPRRSLCSWSAGRPFTLGPCITKHARLAFNFAVTPQLLIKGIIWATLIGLIGGLLPALRAARLPIAAALREL